MCNSGFGKFGWVLRSWTYHGGEHVRTQCRGECRTMSLYIVRRYSLISFSIESFSKSFYVEECAEVEKLEFFGTTLCRQVLHHF